MTEIRLCTCTHAYQDHRYGAFRRVMNSWGKDRVKGYRCTVCDKVSL